MRKGGCCCGRLCPPRNFVPREQRAIAPSVAIATGQSTALVLVCTAIVPVRRAVALGCSERPPYHEVLGHYAVEVPYQVRPVMGRSGRPMPRMAGYWERPRQEAVVAPSGVPDRVRDPMLPLGPSMDGDEANVGWCTNFLNRVNRGWFNVLRHCFGNSDYDEYLELEDRRHKEYRREMLISEPAGCVVPEVDGVVRVPADDVDHLGVKEVVHRPKLVVEAVVALRLMLGTGAMDRNVVGNVALVRSEAAKYMRNRPSTRKVDAAAHLDLIEECFFEDTTHYNSTRWRERLLGENFFTRLLYSKGRRRPLRN